jgi:putative Ca2+/H+ antiporter (TMEM165/GDT1 family)
LAFGAIFFAEIGDKTQLAILAIKSRGMSSLWIFTGAMIAFAILTGITVVFGNWLHTRFSIAIIEKAAAVGFILVGILMWFGKL